MKEWTASFDINDSMDGDMGAAKSNLIHWQIGN